MYLTKIGYRELYAVIAIGWGYVLDSLGGGDSLVYTLLWCMLADIITGGMIALFWHKSPHSKSGCWTSAEGVKGLMRKAGILLAIIVSNRLSESLKIAELRSMAVLFFICNEGGSLVENLAIMGVPFPPAVTAALEVAGERAKINKDAEQG